MKKLFLLTYTKSIVVDLLLKVFFLQKTVGRVGGGGDCRDGDMIFHIERRVIVFF